MAQTLTINVTVGNSGSSNVYSSGSITEISEAFAASNDQLFAFTLDVSQCKVLYLYSEVACTIETNSSSAADATVTLVAGQPVVWTSTNGQTNPFGSTDVARIYVSAAATGTLTIKCLFDPTV